MINYELSSAPFSHSENSSVRIMYIVCFTLVPPLGFGIYQFGLNALHLLLTCAVTAVMVEAMCLRVMARSPRACFDGSALLTAMLLAMSLPPTAPLWVGVLGSSFAILVGKQIFGGLGQNLFNPAMLARVMLLICFPIEMTAWSAPSPIDFSNNLVIVPSLWLEFDGVTAATALSAEVMQQVEFSALFFGTQAGSLGETSAFLVLIGGGYLLYKRLIHWAIPCSLLLGVAVPALISHWLFPNEFLSIHTHLFAGATMLAAFYIATDLVTSPTSIRGQLVYGTGCGLLIWTIRSFGSYPEGVAFAVLVMNATVPLIDHYLRPNVFGSKAAKEC
ncbi:RnfABCDGE type electron transport complex subunit D [Vibrio hangzhouensis]|uniref:Ion-translocating oxidoreductase complex subunit D n=1 Tax=Vibrio hangzhouensis TaxID=462991 RepID=A0A1H5TFB5_9VIBR|nr:RnfABCDGE type electron transport complex subunit D [Vibrio hangzhouensis]SEF61506.1 electron transport complex protein RnfD [Vibrio hangzhouensis]